MNNEKTWQDKYFALIQEINGIDSTMGIYPAAIQGYSSEKDYKERDGYKNGWNAAVIQYGFKFTEAVERSEAGISEELQMLLAADVGWLKDGKLILNLNDAWAWACSDCEEVPQEKITEVADLFRRYGTCGILYWVYKERGNIKTEFKDNNRFIEFVAKEEELRQKEPSSSKRAYMKYKYTLGDE